jgi:SAM-dependent methyltransferase
LSQANFSSPAADWDARYQASQSVWSLEPNQFVAQDLADLTAGSMVDLAGGEGRNALWFASRGWDVTNVEFSKVALEKFQARATSQNLIVKSQLADAASVKFEVDPDLILVAYLQLPWDQLVIALDNALTQQSRGVLYGVWHAKENLEHGHGGPQSKDLLPSELQLKLWLASHGLAGDVKNRTREVQTESGVKRAIDVTLLVRR